MEYFKVMENWSGAGNGILKTAKVVLEPLDYKPKPVKKETVETPANPWHVDNIDDFLHYCCPECDLKSQSREIFINHAILNHPQVL